MKKIYSILSLFLLVIIVTGCQEGLTDISSNNGMGYLKLDVSTVTSTVTKADAIEYDAKQLAVQILDEEGNTVKSTDDYTNWDGELIALKAGRYIIKAASYGYAETMSKPYYAGADTIDIVATETITSKFSCTDAFSSSIVGSLSKGIHVLIVSTKSKRYSVSARLPEYKSCAMTSSFSP